MAGRIKLQSCELERSVVLYMGHVVSKETSSFIFVKKKKNVSHFEIWIDLSRWPEC